MRRLGSGCGGHHGCGRGGGRSRIHFAAEQLRCLFIALADEFHCVALGYHSVELFEICAGHANASVRDGLADGTGFVGSVNAVAVNAQSHPTRAHGIARARLDGLPIVAIDGVGRSMVKAPTGLGVEGLPTATL